MCIRDSKWLGLADQHGRGGDCFLTPEGNAIISMSEKERIRTIRRIMLSDEVFALANANPNHMPSEQQLSQRNMSLATYRNRRKNTVLSWLRSTEENILLI